MVFCLESITENQCSLSIFVFMLWTIMGREERADGVGVSLLSPFNKGENVIANTTPKETCFRERDSKYTAGYFCF